MTAGQPFGKLLRSRKLSRVEKQHGAGVMDSMHRKVAPVRIWKDASGRSCLKRMEQPTLPEMPARACTD
eukprot:6244218-Alexandrium_andersonii.AAC.1